MGNSDTIRILLVDDQRLIRRGLRALLKPEASLEVVGEAENGEAAIAQIPQQNPDVILMDIRMPVMDGVAATQIISERFPEVKVLVLTTFDDDEYVTRALHHGAAGYLLKDTPPDDLVLAIQASYKGYTQLAPGLVPKVLQSPPSSAAPAPPPGWSDLTPREREILQLLATGANNREIAQALYIAEKTVKNHITNILSRLEVRDRTQAALLASRLLPTPADDG
ncbi:MAG: response regulator transcription factor [Spirulinaceae cyanobacterium RM2_2_10]|nr:response regulator transcription factor [Spirulinaceae cyanobacterium SM2_1_0]NJO18883.1 response regulator transcription factor [Spirulinaceae cyanobacterium RM2_2_10]